MGSEEAGEPEVEPDEVLVGDGFLINHITAQVVNLQISEPAAAPAAPRRHRRRRRAPPSRVTGPGEASSSQQAAPVPAVPAVPPWYAPAPSAQLLLDRARSSGQAARRKLASRSYSLPSTPRLDPILDQKHYYVLLRGVEPGLRGYWQGSWHSFRGHVLADGEIVRDAVFHGWRAAEEAWAYWVEATGRYSWTALPPRAV